MKKGFLKRVLRIIETADIVVEVVDARFVQETRNRRMEEHAMRKGKNLLIAINKSDLSTAQELEKQKRELAFPSVFLSSKNRKGIGRLKQAIGKIAAGKKARIAVIGYPNTGKSSVINFLSGRHAARVSSKAGFTRGEQFVRVSENILLIDSPGIIPFEERNPYKLALMGAKNPEQLDDIELAGIMLIQFLQERFPQKIWKITGKTTEKSPEELLELIARKWNRLQKHGIPDKEATAKILLKKWQGGKI